jgi:TPR repeat protein
MIQMISKVKKIGGVLLLAACCLAFSANASAGELDKLAKGQAAFNAGDYTLSFSLWSTLATEGNTNAQLFVGLSYDNGWGTEQNTQLARVWYKKAAKKNNTSAQYLLGLHFIQGTSAERARGLMWLQRAADNGDNAAQNFLEKGKKRGWFKGITPISEPEEKDASQTVALAR